MFNSSRRSQEALMLEQDEPLEVLSEAPTSATTIFSHSKEQQTNLLISSFKMFSSKPRIQKSNSRHCLIVLALISTIQLSSIGHIGCQDFADLNKQQQHTFQPINRQPNPASPVAAPTTQSKNFIQRPVLSSRFAPTGNGNQQQQSLAAQASFSSSVFASPPSVLPAGPGGSSVGQQQLQQATVVGVQQPSTTSQAGVSNIEQLMKNALARTAQMNSAVAEPRQDSAPAPQSAPVESSLTGALNVASPRAAEIVTDASLPSKGQATGEEEKLTTVAQTTTTNGHDTVYSDQRFANLFARRSNNKKSRITPTEQIKAKPTLPSFIKSPPDPKQFSNADNQDSRPVTQSSFVSLRAQQQQQNQGRGNPASNQQKKGVITSNSAATANNKRSNSLNNNSNNNNRQPQNSPRASTSNSKAVTSRPSVSAPASSNPFSRQNSNSDPSANVSSLARKRLANNAVESAKLRQQQNKQTN